MKKLILALLLLNASPLEALPLDDHMDVAKVLDLVIKQAGTLHDRRIVLHTRGGGTFAGEVEMRTDLFVVLREDKGTKTLKDGKKVYLYHHVLLSAVDDITVEAYGGK